MLFFHEGKGFVFQFVPVFSAFIGGKIVIFIYIFLR